MGSLLTYWGGRWSRQRPIANDSYPKLYLNIVTSSRAVLFTFFGLLHACGSAPPPAEPRASSSAASATTAPVLHVTQTVAPSTASPIIAGAEVSNVGVAPSVPAPTPADSAEPGAPSTDEPVLAVNEGLLAAATGPAVGGPKSERPCEFHESVDSYQRRCTATKNPDGSLHIRAKGTKLNPDNGFEFTLHGGPNSFVAHGTLNAFYQCSGPFVAPVVTVIDNGVTTYELRFKQHCKIVVR
jgi:hypothetical protein